MPLQFSSDYLAMSLSKGHLIYIINGIRKKAKDVSSSLVIIIVYYKLAHKLEKHKKMQLIYAAFLSSIA